MHKRIITLLLLLVFVLQTPCYAWFNKKIQSIDSKQKSEYVNMDFWESFNDPYLKNYICLAVKNNHDVRKASWQVEEYRQFVKYSFGQELPHLSMMANYIGIKIPQVNNFSLQKNAFVLPFYANYEADLFLKNRDKTKSEKKSYEAAKYNEKATYISLATSVATTYVNLLQYDALIKAQQEIVRTEKEILNRTVEKFNRGTIKATDLNREESNYKTVQNDLETLIENREKILTQLAVLVGESPENISELKRSTMETFEYVRPIPDSVSSDVIFSRPDIMKAETTLEKAKIDVRVARKEFLPTFNINGIYAFSTFGTGNFFSWQSTLAAIVAGASQNLFMGGMKVANLRIMQSRYEQMFEDYKQADLIALKEVNDALYFIKIDTKIDNTTNEKLALQKDDLTRAEKMYSRGVIAYPELLAARQSCLNMAQNKIQTKSTRLVNYFTLYQAVGGKL